jgi:hypothetical protein
MSECGHNVGTVFSVDMKEGQYKRLLHQHDVPTLRGAVILLGNGQLDVIELPETGYHPQQTRASQRCVVSRLPTFGVNRWPWGRCCCVPHPATNVQTPVTVEAVEAGHVPWWPEDQTPFEIDLAAADTNPESRAMLIFPQRSCGVCGHDVWVVYPEEEPAVPPPDADEMDYEYVDIDPSILRRVTWTSKQAAWRTFSADPHNQRIIGQSGLPIETADERQRYTHEAAFADINTSLSRRVTTVKQAFYAALGPGRGSGNWSKLDLPFLRQARGLGGLDIPHSVCLECDELAGKLDVSPGACAPEAAHCENASATAEGRAVAAMLDDEADLLSRMLDEDEAGLGEFDDLLADVAEFAEEPLPNRPTDVQRPTPSTHLRDVMQDAELAVERLRSVLRGN